jgi:protein gp37
LVFCASQADFLDPEVPVEWLADLQQLIVATPHLTWQLLTKRPELWRERFEAVRDLGGTSGAAVTWLGKIPPRNVWLGVTVEDQKRADERIMALRAIPALVRFVSMEPLLEEVDLRRIKIPEGITDVLNGHYGESIPVMDWIIVGGESGPNARPFNLAWARSIVKQCKEAGVKVWVKQMGDWTVADGNNARGLKMLQLDAKDYGLRDDLVRVRFSTHHGADPAEWPEDLRVQEFPV